MYLIFCNCAFSAQLLSFFFCDVDFFVARSEIKKEVQRDGRYSNADIGKCLGLLEVRRACVWMYICVVVALFLLLLLLDAVGVACVVVVVYPYLTAVLLSFRSSALSYLF